MTQKTRIRPSLLYEELGRKIAGIRKELAMTQTELAEKVNITQQLIAAFETGTRRMPLETLLRISIVLHVSVSNLLPAPEPIRKPGPQPKIALACEKLQKLSEKEQKIVMSMIDSLTDAATRLNE